VRTPSVLETLLLRDAILEGELPGLRDAFLTGERPVRLELRDPEAGVRLRERDSFLGDDLRLLGLFRS